MKLDRLKMFLKQINKEFYKRSANDVILYLIENDKLNIEVCDEEHLTQCKFKREILINNILTEIVYYSNDDRTTEMLYIQTI